MIELAWNDHSACFDTVRDPELERLAAQEAEYGVRYDNDEPDGYHRHP